MHDPSAFLHIPRIEPPRQPARQRLRHWREYESLLPDAQSARQSDRCMDCGVPWCHSHCPVHNQIPEWNGLVSAADWHAAWEQLESTNNFPEFTGRLCPAPCEHACTLRLSGAPVTIRAIELAIIEQAWESGWVCPQPPTPTHGAPRRIAVVGSGPAGLACAQQLARAGHRVMVYERDERIGGLLRYGIPDFRLEKWVLDRRLEQLRAEGVRFCSNTRVGVDLDSDALRSSVDALVLACGSTEPRDVPVKGRGLAGVHFALDYLSQQNRRVAGAGFDGNTQIDARGLDVVIVGGGDTGSDCVGTALRQGAHSVTQIQYHAEPPTRGDVLEYWPEPVLERHADDHEAEGGQRLWGWATVGLGGERGKVFQVELQRLRWRRDNTGPWRRELIPETTQRLPAQLVLIAVGYQHPVHGDVIGGLGLRLDEHGNVAANDQDYRTSCDGVFACGDTRRGQSLVVWAIREGRQCAEAVDRYLTGASDLPRV